MSVLFSLANTNSSLCSCTCQKQEYEKGFGVYKGERLGEFSRKHKVNRVVHFCYVDLNQCSLP
jgi:hypothetical protein